MTAGPRSRRRTLVIAGAGVLTLAVVALAVVYFLVLPTSSPKPFSLTSSTAAAAAATGTASTAAASAGTGTASTAAAAASGTSASATSPSAAAGGAGGSLAGVWTIATGSRAGYRVREKLGFLPAESDAVGRTGAITGSATVRQSGSTLTIPAASFKVAVNTLKSDQSMRDQHIQTIGIQSATYPTATFVLADPVTLPAAAVTGKIVRASVTGVFDIHGASRKLTMPIQLRATAAQIEAVGSLTFPWGEFNMTAPSVAGFVNVSSTATMEFDLRLRRG